MEFAASQASSRVELDNGTVLSACDQCRAMHAERKPPTEPPCDACRVELLEENADAARIYQLTRGQVVTVGEQVIDLNHVAVWKNIEKYKVKDQTGCFELVNKVFHYFLSKEREK